MYSRQDKENESDCLYECFVGVVQCFILSRQTKRKNISPNISSNTGMFLVVEDVSCRGREIKRGKDGENIDVNVVHTKREEEKGHSLVGRGEGRG